MMDDAGRRAGAMEDELQEEVMGDEGQRFAAMVRADRQRADTRARVNLCVACARQADDDMMTTCDECARTLCGYCAHSLSGDDVVCPDCYNAATGGE